MRSLLGCAPFLAASHCFLSWLCPLPLLSRDVGLNLGTKLFKRLRPIIISDYKIGDAVEEVDLVSERELVCTAHFLNQLNSVYDLINNGILTEHCIWRVH
ncbi:hypothetical protein ACLOJK_034396 [Asimina triloba]